MLVKVGVWCTVSVDGIEPLIFLETVNFRHYARLIVTMFSQLTDEEMYKHCMQGSTAAYTANSCMGALYEVFSK
jgi:hypothetical protein